MRCQRQYLCAFKKNCKPPSSLHIPKLIIPKIREYADRKYKLFNDSIDLTHINWKEHINDTLFQYHLHYNDFILGIDKGTGLDIILNWIHENPPSDSIEWDPYTISIRVVNWIKFIAKFDIKDQTIYNSLHLQGIWLYHQREFHLLANHFFKNIVALLYLGYVFSNKKWFQWALHDLNKQIDEQITKEGYHFEFSPTYHAIFTKDLLNVYNLLSNNDCNVNNETVRNLQNVTSSALYWNQYYYDKEGYLPINDVNYQDTPQPDEIIKLAQVLGINSKKNQHSSYYPTINNGSMKIMMCCAPFNPPYNPSHSHADINSVLLWYNGKRILVDTGNYTYSESDERAYSRSTKAHNTIEIDSSDQAEMWKAFRVGNRAFITEPEISSKLIRCTYKFRNISHSREIKIENDAIIIRDILLATGEHAFRMFFHFSPNCSIQLSENNVIIDNNMEFILSDENIVGEKTSLFPKMYIKEDKDTLIVSGRFVDTKFLETRIRAL
ncbi:MAG: alginate lyase family protein [Candidatus Cloacimonetes bacterium]|nr:alginate lyase family protein [Candidatus Cloacimonadota bacterium]